MEDSSVLLLREWVKELAGACEDAELLDFVYKLLLIG